MNELTNFQMLAASASLQKLLYGDAFYISEMDGIAKLIGVQLGGQDYLALRGLHCMKWGELPEPFRTQVREKVVELLGLPPLVIEAQKGDPSQEGQKSEPERKPRLAFWK